jgi:hypothetical protein
MSFSPILRKLRLRFGLPPTPKPRLHCSLGGKGQGDKPLDRRGFVIGGLVKLFISSCPVRPSDLLLLPGLKNYYQNDPVCQLPDSKFSQ